MALDDTSQLLLEQEGDGGVLLGKYGQLHRREGCEGIQD